MGLFFISYIIWDFCYNYTEESEKMKYKSSDPDLETIVKRIERGSLKLQPDFQRGEVWTSPKKTKLIDTLLRGWQIPPVHIIQLEDSNVSEVLDGQQRLAAIRDFFSNKIKIDGGIEPEDIEIKKLDGLTFNELPEDIKYKLEEMPLRIFTIYEYNPEETAELFYRLNQPVALTSAEQRNAFYGSARTQVKNIVNIIDNEEEIKKKIGFSNSRMAYDDIISKFCYAKEKKSLKVKITSNDVAVVYRTKLGFTEEVVKSVRSVVDGFVRIIGEVDGKLRLNKATVFSWLCFLSRHNEAIGLNDTRKLAEFLDYFEGYRKQVKYAERNNFSFSFFEVLNDDIAEKLILIFNQRCSMGSTDVSSIIIRDVILWYFYYEFNSNMFNLKLAQEMIELKFLLAEKENVSIALDEFIKITNWGDV